MKSNQKTLCESECVETWAHVCVRGVVWKGWWICFGSQKSVCGCPQHITMQTRPTAILSHSRTYTLEYQHRSNQSVITWCFVLPSCHRAAVQQWTDGPAAGGLLLVLLPFILSSISLSPLSAAVLQPSPPVLAHYLAARSLGSGTHCSSALLISQLPGELHEGT